MIPLLHDFSDARVLVIGGGSVGARKARRFAREARTVVFSSTFADAEFGGAERVRVQLTPADVGVWFDRVNPTLVVAATDDVSLNEAIDTEASERGVLVNRADERGGRRDGSVIVPATVRRDPAVIAIATGGRSPALSRYLRKHLEEDPYVDGAGEMAELTGDIHDCLRERDVEPQTRRRLIRDLVKKDRVWKALDTPGTNQQEVAESVISDVIGDTV